ncbi:hypothetical protein F2P81_023838 [Scophthalmus maximus]|uniref:Uncharacterized protein n=1 Tax=Scophthalmus maximus TaxID=52904 RepID=A0A6A4RT36_SCOMX|nr:hypothetical protein F2P81_023838 [Scophthalmus maximus]
MSLTTQAGPESCWSRRTWLCSGNNKKKNQTPSCQNRRDSVAAVCQLVKAVENRVYSEPRTPRPQNTRALNHSIVQALTDDTLSMLRCTHGR